MKMIRFESEVYFKLQAAEREAELTDRRYSPKEVLQAMREAIGGHGMDVSANCRNS